MANAVITPATASTGSGHHQGAVSNPSALGRCWNTESWIHGITVRKHHAARETSRPTAADRINKRR
jgi:hypothetical protein